MAESLNTGYFGKIPSRGDFVSRGFNADFTQHWDAWLQRGMSASQSQLGSSWHDIYMSSPIWRFALSPGACDSHFWLGLLLPSVDQIGRHFPLTIATRIEHDTFSTPIVEDNDPWFNAAEQLALAVLQGGVSAESFDEQIDQLQSPYASDARHQARFSGSTNTESNNPHWIIGATVPGQYSDGLALVALELMMERYSNYSTWWTSGSQIVAPSMMMCANLPSPSGFASFLDGNWDRDGWNNRFLLPAEEQAIHLHG